MNERTISLIGEEKFQSLKNSTVAIIGLGGVGGYVAEHIARMNVGNLILVDGDVIEESNINRQIIASKDNIGKNKAEEFKLRAQTISDSKIIAIPEFIDKENMEAILKGKIDYIADCIDRLKDKIDLIKHAKNKGYKIISAMGAGNRYKTCQYTVTDIFDTKGDALARKLRGELRKCEVDSLEVVYTDSESVKCKEVIGSVSYIPALCGSIMSAHIINKLIGE